MDLTQLQTLVEGAVTNNTLVISGTQFGSPNIETLFQNFLPEARLEIHSTTLESAADKIVVSGQMPQPIFAIVNAGVRAEFTIVNGQAEAKLTISQLPTYWRFSSSFPALLASLFDSFNFTNPEFILESLPTSLLQPDFQTAFGYQSGSVESETPIKRGLSFQGQLTLDGPFLLLSWLLNDGQPFVISGPIGLIDDLPGLVLQATIAQNLTLEPFQFPITFQLVSVWYQFEDPARTIFPAIFARLSARIIHDSSTPPLEIPIAVQFYSTDLSILTFESNLEQLSHFGLSELSALLQSTDVNSLIPDSFPALSNIALSRLSLTVSLAKKELSNILIGVTLISDDTDEGWKIVPGVLSFRDLHLTFNANNVTNASQRSITVDAFGKVDIAHGTIDGYISLPSLNFTCELEAGTQIEITELVKSILSTDLSGLPTINCTQLLITGDVPTTSYSMFMTIESNWTFTIDATAIILKELTLGIEHSGAQNGIPSSTWGQIGATIDIGQATALILAQSTEADQGWTFVGQIARINFTDLTEQFLAAVSLPTALPDVVIDDIYMSVTPQTGAFSFRGESDTRWEIIPENFVISRAGIDAERDEAGQLSVELFGTVDVLNLTGLAQFILNALSVTVHFPSIALNDVEISVKPIEGQFQLSGSLSVGQKFPFKDLGSAFGSNVTVPATLETLHIDHFSISFKAQPPNKNFFFTCTSQLPLDQTGQDKLAITVTLNVIDHNGTYTIDAGGHIELTVAGLATPLIFDLRFTEDSTTTAFIAAYSHTGGAQSLKLVNLIKSIVHTDSELIGLIPETLAIDLKDILFVYFKDTAGTETTPQQGRFLFGLDIGANLDLSKLPLVGSEFPPDQKISVDDLQLLVTSKPFTIAEVGVINGLLPAGVTPLPDVSKNTNAAQPANTQTPLDPKANALEQGLNVAAKLNLSVTTQQTFALPVAAGTDSGGQSNTPTTPAQPDVTSSDSAKWFTIQKSLGPVYFNRIGFQYKDRAVYFLLDAALSAAGLTLSLDGLGFGSPLDHFEPKFDLHGLGIDYKNGALEIGGAFLRVTRPDATDEYDGMAIIKTAELTLEAIGSYTRLDGHPSLFIYAMLGYPIGGPAFFFITGLAAGFGYNRRLLVPTIDQLQNFPLIEEAINNTGDMRNLAGELRKLSTYIPPAVDHYFLAVGIKFTSFKMIDSFALVTVSFGERFELDVLGLSTMILPTPEVGQVIEPVAEVQMALKATFIPDEGFLGVQAQLTSNAYILSRNCHLTGGFAFFAWFKGEHRGDFVTTLGGYHPSYNRPTHYPVVPRLGFNWQVDSYLLIKGDAYCALTPSTLMAGGHLEVTWKKGSLEAYFRAGADFLISWKPYHYDISIYVHMGVKYTYHFFGTHHISVDVGADLHIWGPNFSGVAHVHLWIVSFSVTFGAGASQQPKPISWTQFYQSFLPKDKALDASYQGTETVCTLALQAGLLKTPDDNGNIDWVVNPKTFTLVTNSVIPAKTHDVGQGHLTDAAYNTSFGIGPMNNQVGDVKQSSHVVTIFSITEHKTETGATEQIRTDASAQFEFTPIRKNVPVGIWGQALKPQLNGQQLVENTLTGFEIRPKDPVLSPPPEATADVERAKFKYTVEPINKVYNWQGYQAFHPAETQGKTVINQKLTEASARQAILTGLGLTSAEIMLNDKTANAFLVSPQVGS